ncbi:hypothetical protein ACFE04_005173 [Oxalis oulophora]
MTHHRETYASSLCGPSSSFTTDLSWPFGKLDSLDADDIRETAYEIFFTSCRSSPGFGGRNNLTFYSSHNDENGDRSGGGGNGSPGSVSGSGMGSPGSAGRVNMTPTSKVKRMLGLKMIKRSPSRRMSTGGSIGGGSAPVSPSSHGHANVNFGPGTFSTVPEETLVLDEVDELLELMKKTWSTLGINRAMHNICFTWALFHQYVATAQMEPDLLCAAHAMLAEVANDARRSDREITYVKLLSSVLNSIQEWAEKKLLNYHSCFTKGTAGQIENLLPLAISASRILGEDVTITSEVAGPGTVQVVDSTGDRVDHYIRSSVKRAFQKIIEDGNERSAKADVREEPIDALFQLAKETEDLALREREGFSPVLKRWNSIAASVAAVTLHQCYGKVLMQYLGERATLTSETVDVLQRAGKLERILVQMVVEDSAECEDGGKSVVREMVPYEVDSIILKLLRQWIDERLSKGKECLHRAKESETWNPKSKSEPYAQSGVELIKLAEHTIDDFFKIPIGITDDLVLDLADGLEMLFRDYSTFVSSCGSKQSYLPTLPPLTRCHTDSKFVKLWKLATPCAVSADEVHHIGPNEGHHPRPSTSRGTQRLYIRLNTLHYFISHLPSLEKTLALSPRITTQRSRLATDRKSRHNGGPISYFESALNSLQTACQHVSEVAAYRLIFLDSNSVFYESLYVGDVTNARIRPALRTLKQNFTLLTAILNEEAQGLAMREVMKAAFEAYLMVLLAGGASRIFYRTDHQMIEEDFNSLKKVFATCGEGLINEDLIDREAETVDGVVGLMGQSTEQLVEDFSIVTCETSGVGVVNSGQILPMPPTTGRWNRSDPNTILRVLCHRNDRGANAFLKKTFQLSKTR